MLCFYYVQIITVNCFIWKWFEFWIGWQKRLDVKKRNIEKKNTDSAVAQQNIVLVWWNDSIKRNLTVDIQMKHNISKVHIWFFAVVENRHQLIELFFLQFFSSKVLLLFLFLLLSLISASIYHTAHINVNKN